MHKSLLRLPFANALRDTYLRTIKPTYWAQHVKQKRDFYAQFVRPNSLVFDVGANNGEYTRCFLSLGARVVAVEPQPTCVDSLKLIRNPKVTVLACAVGAEIGQGQLHLSQHDTLSTMSNEWRRRASETARFSESKWEEDIFVPVTTLHELMSRYGMPDFIKIDVEGFESQVLDGLDFIPNLLSFEFNTEWIETTLECLQKPCFPADAEFAYYTEEPSLAAFSRWMDRNEMMAIVKRDLRHLKTYGDIWVRTTTERAKRK